MSEYQHYYSVYRRNGQGYLVKAFDSKQATAKVRDLACINDQYLSVCKVHSQ